MPAFQNREKRGRLFAMDVAAAMYDFGKFVLFSSEPDDMYARICKKTSSFDRLGI